MQNRLPPPWSELSSSVLLRFLLLVASGWAAVQLVAYFQNVLVMFIGAAILAVLLDYPVRRLSGVAGCPRWLAILLTALGVTGLVVTLVAMLGFQVVNQGTSLIADLAAELKDPDLPLHGYLKTIDPSQLLSVLRSSFSTGLGLVGGALSNVFAAIFLPVIVIYMLADNGRLWQALLQLVPAAQRDRLDRSVQRNILGFLRGQITLVIFLTISSALVFALLGVKFSLVLAIVVGVLDAIPGIGATLGVVVVSAIVLLTQGPWTALSVVIASVILQQIQDNLIHPRVMGRALAIHPVVLFFALFVGERLAGLLGVFLAIPVAGMILSWERDGAAP